MCWNERVNDANSFFVGQTIKAQIRIESREFNGKWYTDVTAFRLDIDQPTAQPAAQPMNQTPPQMPHQPLPPMNEDYFASDNGDDLPF